MGADQVNLSRDAFRLVVSFGDEPVAEERLATVAGDVDLVADASARLGQVERVQVIANTGSLPQPLSAELAVGAVRAKGRERGGRGIHMVRRGGPRADQRSGTPWRVTSASGHCQSASSQLSQPHRSTASSSGRDSEPGNALTKNGFKGPGKPSGMWLSGCGGFGDPVQCGCLKKGICPRSSVGRAHSW